MDQTPALPAAYKVRVFINDTPGTYLDVGVSNTSWLDWLRALNFYNGLAHDKGYIPLHAIKLIVHLDEEGKSEMPMGENVVPFTRKP